MTVSLPDSLAPNSFSELTVDRDDLVGTIAAGGSLFWGNGVEARFRYEAGIGENTLSHSASLKLGLKF